MNSFVFDLDDTLYTKNHIDYNPNLNILLKQLQSKGKLYIFSNNKRLRGLFLIMKLKLKALFHNRLQFSNNSNIKKPNNLAYSSFIEKFKPHGNVFFFDNSIKNLKYSKKYGWNTILINKNIQTKSKDIDFRFDSIDKAIYYLLKHI